MSETRNNRYGSNIRKRPVSFGNPALGVYHGFVYTQDDSDDDAVRPLIEGAVDVRRLVAMVDVPPEQVPEGILNLARSHRPWIEHVRIVIAEPPPPPATEGTSASRSSGSSSTTPAAAASVLPTSTSRSASSEQPPSSPSSRTYLVLLELSTEDAADIFVQDLHRKPYTSLDETQVCRVYHVIALQGEDGVSLMSPFFAPSTNSNKSSLEMEDYHCAVCLEHMDLAATAADATSILTTVCNHSFHMECLLQWQDSPCPVCRYDHSGLNEALSQCHQCGTTEHNYVCLICGLVSCGGGGGAAGSSRTDDAACSTTATTTTPAIVEARARQQQRHHHHHHHQNHARQHYDETLHAYALDTETQHVWDFAGQGYVHRLLQNKDDGKLVEVSDPHNTTSQERTLSPGLSTAQEGEMVHRKLEGFASQYYTLLKSQLEQQRIYYESRLEEIRHEFSNNATHQQHGSNSSSTELLLTALRQERHQLSQRLGSLRAKCRKTKDDVAFLRNMNESLQANKAPLQEQITQASQERLETHKMFQDLLPPLQEKVTRLMLQLESDLEKKPAPRTSH